MHPLKTGPPPSFAARPRCPAPPARGEGPAPSPPAVACRSEAEASPAVQALALAALAGVVLVAAPVPRADPIEAALSRMLDTPLPVEQQRWLAEGLRPFGPAVIRRLEQNGLRVRVESGAYPHFLPSQRTLTLDADALTEENAVAGMREYMVLHEFAHALDFLWEPQLGPLSGRADLGISAHRDRLRALHSGLRAPDWEPAPEGSPEWRVFRMDRITAEEAAAGTRLAERPVRGKPELLRPEASPSEYFADSVYAYLNRVPPRTYRYELPDGRSFEHAYPPGVRELEQRDPRMFQALEQFFRTLDSARLSIPASAALFRGNPPSRIRLTLE